MFGIGLCVVDHHQAWPVRACSLLIFAGVLYEDDTIALIVMRC